MADLLIRNVGLLATPVEEERDNTRRVVRRIRRAAILIQNGNVTAIGAEEEVIRQAPAGISVHDAKGGLALPGLVDCHTHPVFVGNRAAEFHQRNTGKTYLEISAAGGGIQTSASKVREASVEQIVEESLPRFHRSLTGGVTTIEAKSGYGLDWAGERKLLDSLGVIAKRVPQRIHKTFLIHAVPENRKNDRERFTREVSEEMIPAVARERLADSVDVFCETGAFTVDESRRFMHAARAHGLGCMVHANQFGNSGGALLAAEVKVRSAHHLEFLNEEEMHAMAEAGTVAVVLPASVFFLGNLPYPPVRKMVDHGLRIAIATDMNAGSSMTESLPFCLTTAAIYCKMSPDELLWGATYEAARALDLHAKLGSLEPGKVGDVSLWNVPDLESVSYHFGDLRAAAVFVDGEKEWEDCDESRRY